MSLTIDDATCLDNYLKDNHVFKINLVKDEIKLLGYKFNTELRYNYIDKKYSLSIDVVKLKYKQNSVGIEAYETDNKKNLFYKKYDTIEELIDTVKNFRKLYVYDKFNVKYIERRLADIINTFVN